MRTITLLCLLLALASCRWKADGKAEHKEPESPVISSLRDSGLPCFKCHSFEKFSIDESGRFSHKKHLDMGVHCDSCHQIIPHREMSLKKDTCGRCHGMTVLAYTATPLQVNFTHQKHAERFRCSECHPGLFTMKKGSARMLMDDMYKGNSCGKCHNGKKAFAAKECAKCHNLSAISKDLSYASEGMTPAIFSHQVHTAMFECASCHTGVFKYKKGGSGMKMDDLYAGKFCATCHNGQTAFGSSDCARCHK